MRLQWTAAAAALVLLGAAAPAAEKADLKVLYAGNVDSPRGRDFMSFLQEHFTRVTPVALGKFREGDARGHDVVLIDWTSIYPRDKDGKITHDKQAPGISMPPGPKLSRDYDRPTVLIGAAGGQTAGPLQLQIDWL